MPTHSETTLYRIGTVASLTGVSVERLRAWERRYGFTPTAKQGRIRFYDAAQLQRLGLMKRLTDCGQAISNLIDLDSDQLQEQLDRLLSVAAETDPRTASAVRSANNTASDPSVAPDVITDMAPDVAPDTPTDVRLEALPHSTEAQVKVALVGPQLLHLEFCNRAATALDVVDRWANSTSLLGSSTTHLDAVTTVVQLPVLTLSEVDALQHKLPHCPLILLYQFASSSQLSACQDRGLTVLRWPVSWTEIEHACITRQKPQPSGNALLPRRFSDEELIAMAAEVNDPHAATAHLIESIHHLNGLSHFLLSEASSKAESPRASATSQFQPLRAAPTAGFAELTAASQHTSRARAFLEHALASIVSESAS
tara:strand:+ start:857 stop:1960 length:1104 start_codon:yes stop_codon:yes gene_type:complete